MGHFQAVLQWKGRRKVKGFGNSKERHSSEEIRKDFKEGIVFELGTKVWEEFGNSEVLRKHSK